ncbi:hypothetical protein J6590_057387 [Homalodisca vitripennis]|nr:hypothetical protein J6590_057387 [Homalodisca vitripennis]
MLKASDEAVSAMRPLHALQEYNLPQCNDACLCIHSSSSRFYHPTLPLCWVPTCLTYMCWQFLHQVFRSKFASAAYLALYYATNLYTVNPVTYFDVKYKFIIGGWFIRNSLPLSVGRRLVDDMNPPMCLLAADMLAS